MQGFAWNVLLRFLHFSIAHNENAQRGQCLNMLCASTQSLRRAGRGLRILPKEPGQLMFFIIQSQAEYQEGGGDGSPGMILPPKEHLAISRDILFATLEGGPIVNGIQ